MKRKPICVTEYEKRSVLYEEFSSFRLYNRAVNIQKRRVELAIPEEYKSYEVFGGTANYVDVDSTIHDKAEDVIERIVAHFIENGEKLPGFFQVKIENHVLNCKFFCFEVYRSYEEIVARYECLDCIPLPNYEVPFFICLDSFEKE